MVTIRYNFYIFNGNIHDTSILSIFQAAGFFFLKEVQRSNILWLLLYFPFDQIYLIYKQNFLNMMNFEVFISARNEVGANVFTGVCHSVNRGWGCLPQCMLGYTPLSRHAPPGADTAPEQNHPPGADTPPEQTHPPNRHPPEQTPPWADTPPRTRYTPSGLNSPPRTKYTPQD